MSDGTQNNESAKTAGTPPDAGRKPALYRMRRRLHRKWPSLFGDPNLPMYRAYHRDRDPEENTKTEPPADERVDLLCIWAVEFYTPAHIKSLLENLAALGWNKEEFGENDAVSWVQKFRESAVSWGNFGLGAIVRPGAKRIFGRRRRGPLPAGVDYAIGDIFSLTSSITCVSIGFVLDESYGKRIDEGLRRKYETQHVPLGTGYSIHGPQSQKQGVVDNLRSDVRGLASGWFKAHLPGLFSSGVLDGEFPTCELITLQSGKPFSDQGGTRDYLEVLDLWGAHNTWQLEEVREIKFTWPPLRREQSRFHAIAAVNVNDLPEQKLEMYGGRDRSGCLGYVDDCIDHLLPRWALLALVTAYERHLNAVRDSAAFRPLSSEKSLAVLDRLRGLVSQSADTSAVAAELISYTERKGLFNDVAKFEPAQPQYWEKDITLAEALRLQVNRRAQWLQNTDRSARDLLIHYGSVLGARENIKLQSTVRWLTWVLVVLTIAILGLTAIMAYPVLGALMKE